MHLEADDTIAAIASAPGPGVRGIVRVTGPRAWEVATVGFTSSDGAALARPDHAQAIIGQYRLDGLRPPLPATLFVGHGSRTYTGQPLVEVQTLGAPALLQHLLGALLKAGARLANPGEFTLRAFLSGRIDLTRAEAVLGVIEANTSAQLDAALRQLAGGLFGPIAALRERLIDILAHLEANLDFVDEHDVSDLARDHLAAELSAASGEVNALADRLRARETRTGMPVVVLVGPPNAGKSCLFNALLDEHRSIVSPQPGTTRDYVSASCDCDGLIVELVDTAGHEAPRDAIEALAQSHRDEQATRADLLLDCRPATEPRLPLRHDSESGPPGFRVLTKADLDPEAVHPDSFLTSATTGLGLDALRSAIARALRTGDRDGDLPATTGARCRDTLTRAGVSLGHAADTLLLGGGDELVALDLRHALDALAQVVGATVTDDILDRIFQRFCIGK